MECDASTSAVAAEVLEGPVLLCWTDAESGEDVWVRVFGPREFVAELESQGFRVVEPPRARSFVSLLVATAVA